MGSMEGAPMEKYLRTPIKEIIAKHPPVGALLEEYGIGCVPCSVGTCLLADIVEIHNLSPEDEGTLMARIAGIVSPGQVVALPEPRKRSPETTRKISYSPPMMALVEEHRLIKRVLAVLPAVIDRFDAGTKADREFVGGCLDFIRSYADRFHHAKEEDILFACFDPGLDILKAMHEDHERGRAHVRAAGEALARGDKKEVAANLHGYAGVLAEHIRKEDEILYPWMDRNLSIRQVGELFARFRAVDERFAEDRKKHESFVGQLEDAYAEPVSKTR
jgi:hemerythrin-like domain-containing protein